MGVQKWVQLSLFDQNGNWVYNSHPPVGKDTPAGDGGDSLQVLTESYKEVHRVANSFVSLQQSPEGRRSYTEKED